MHICFLDFNDSAVISLKFSILMWNLIICTQSDYSVGQFFEEARQATRDILNSGRVPIVSGGTGLYLRW